MDLKWVGCQYPTPALAQEAELSVEAFADFLYGACLLDWDVERERMQRYAERFDQADEVRLVGFGTFAVGKRAARSGRNPRTGAAIKIKAAKVPKFRPGKALKDALN